MAKKTDSKNVFATVAKYYENPRDVEARKAMVLALGKTFRYWPSLVSELVSTSGDLIHEIEMKDTFVAKGVAESQIEKQITALEDQLPSERKVHAEIETALSKR